MHYQEKVKEFMNTFGQYCPPRPYCPEENTRILRVKLLLEEVLELAEASGVDIITKGIDVLSTRLVKSGDIRLKINEDDVNIYEVADAIADISYVNYGAANAYGINIAPIEDEVHASNMTKLFTEDEVQGLDKRDFSIEKVGDRYLVKNNDGKVQKSPSYTTADIAKHIHQQIITNAE
jgi:predicted HAD superfamily Cof-like phosphohydrolase